MTTVATDGKTMACDGQSEVCGTIVAQDSPKIVRLQDGSLFGSAGKPVDRQRVKEYLESGGKKPKVGGFQGLVLKADGRLLYMNEELVATEVKIPCAVGSGMDFALGAMDHGATPEEAVAIAIERDPGSGGLISVVALHELRAAA